MISLEEDDEEEEDELPLDVDEDDDVEEPGRFTLLGEAERAWWRSVDILLTVACLMTPCWPN